MNNKVIWYVILVALILGAFGAVWYIGDNGGYTRATSELKAQFRLVDAAELEAIGDSVFNYAKATIEPEKINIEVPVPYVPAKVKAELEKYRDSLAQLSVENRNLLMDNANLAIVNEHVGFLIDSLLEAYNVDLVARAQIRRGIYMLDLSYSYLDKEFGARMFPADSSTKLDPNTFIPAGMKLVPIVEETSWWDDLLDGAKYAGYAIVGALVGYGIAVMRFNK